MAVVARETWTDERLDDLNTKVAGIDRRMEAGFGEVREEFRAVRAEMNSLHRTTLVVLVSGFATMLVGFAGTIATILVTQT
jgi:hypothetical protein